jgi:hypothetical protein
MPLMRQQAPASPKPDSTLAVGLLITVRAFSRHPLYVSSTWTRLGGGAIFIAAALKVFWRRTWSQPFRSIDYRPPC